MLFMKNGPSEETEEGEVDDGSEPEEADSDPSSPADILKSGHGRNSKSGNAGAACFRNRSVSTAKADLRNGLQATSLSSLERAAPTASHAAPHNVYNPTRNNSGSGPARDMVDASSSPNQPSYPTENPQTVKGAPWSDIPSFSLPPPPQIPNPGSIPMQQAPYLFPPPAPAPNGLVNPGTVRHPGWLPTVPSITPSGSQQEIEQMHQMYQKACELYEKAMEKINASGVKLPMGMLPRPPAPFVPLTVTTVPSGADATNQHSPAPLAGSIAPGLLPPAPPPPPSLPTQPHPPPSAPSALSSNPAYQAAYASAYQQTMKAIPAPQDGGPAPNSPEFGATWQRYMDHYLRYYLRSSGITMPGEQRAPNSTPSPTVATTGTSNVAADIAAAMMPTNPADIELPPSPKRSRPTDVAREDDKSNRSRLESEAAKKPPVTSSGQSADQSVKSADEGKHETEPQKPNLVDDVNASKCVWVSNLPQGVKAVDIKDRCTPFGRVQTIKIIGSRKSKPPSIYAYLIMETPDAAGRLVDGLQGAKFGNNEIKLKRINALPIP